MRARCGCGRYRLRRSIRYVCAVIRDGKPVPYGDHRNCANVSTEFVGEAFRLPRGGTQAAPYDTQGTLHENVAGHAGGTGDPSPTRVFDYAVLYR